VSAACGFNAQPLDALSTEGVQILLVVDIADVIGRMRPSRIDYVFEVGPLLCNRADFFLRKMLAGGAY
jgi:hypothetical protein